MAVASNAKSELIAMLAMRSPQIICIRGDWGIGKTYLWNAALESSVRLDQCAYNRYSYVSLFGLTSLHELRNSITENMRLVTGSPNDINITSKEITNKMISGGGRIAGFVAAMTGFTEALDRATNLLFSAIREQIVCLDDLERSGESLSLGSILGLASFLKDERKCKVIIILNHNKLQTQEHTWKLYYEKIVDIDLSFAPTVSEALAIAIGDTKDYERITKRVCTVIRVSNIRIIRKMVRFAERLSAIVKGYGSSVHEHVITTTCIFAWAKLGPDQEDSLQFIRKYRKFDYVFATRDNPTSSDTRWAELLNDLNFEAVPDLDDAIWAGIQGGIFDENQIRAAASRLKREAANERKSKQFQDAWSALSDLLSLISGNLARDY